MPKAERLSSKFHSCPRSLASQPTTLFFGQSFSLGHYPPIYQPTKGVYWLHNHQLCTIKTYWATQCFINWIVLSALWATGAKRINRSSGLKGMLKPRRHLEIREVIKDAHKGSILDNKRFFCMTLSLPLFLLLCSQHANTVNTTKLILNWNITTYLLHRQLLHIGSNTFRCFSWFDCSCWFAFC